MIQRTICLDFDGVIHPYSQGWKGGEIYDVPASGTREALRELSKHHRLVICTARHNLSDVIAWLRKHHLSHYIDDVTNRKPAAILYVDDRAMLFTGNWQEVLDATSEL